jgi:DNA sulfur modification protein DndD
MRFSRIEVENWGPYRGQHQIDISATPSAPLVLIFGENGRGKTSLAKAIKWCLYEGQSDIDALSMANRQMASLDDEFQVGVKVVFEYEKVTGSGNPASIQTFELSRTFKVKSDARSTHGVRVVGATEKSLVIDGEPEISSKIDKTIVRLAPLEMSKFLLFDGEELNRMIEDLGGNEQVSVRGRIESTMGLPALTELDQKIGQELKAIEKRVKIKSKNQALDTEIDQLTAGLSQVKNQRNDSAAELKKLEVEVEALRRSLETFESFTATIRLLDAQKTLLKKKKAQLDNKREEIIQSTSANWWLPLGDRILVRQKRELQRQADTKTKEEIQVLEKILKTHRCDVCNAEHSDLAHIKVKIEEIQKKLDQSGELEDHLPSFNEIFPEVGAKKVTISVLFQDERELIHEVKEINDDILKYEAELVNIDQNTHNTVLADYSHKTKLVERASALISNLDLDISKRESELLAKRRERTKMGDVPAEDEAQQVALLQLQEIVSNLRDNLTEQVRQEVEKIASLHYSTMMENPDLIGVKITPDYSIRAVHRTLGEKPISSFGQSLVYVYAFVAALIEVSDRPTPWLIDTVGSRLDSNRMKAVWLWLANRDRQIIAMPHSNELTPEQAREWMFDSVSHMYEIVPNELQDSDSRFEEISA